MPGVSPLPDSVKRPGRAVSPIERRPHCYHRQLFELTAENALDYLRGRGVHGAGGRGAVIALGGGVSNTVLLIEGCGLVLKQSLGKLRVEQDWFSDRRRIYREAAALRALAPHLPPGSLPEVLFEDRENCLFAMTAAPAGARPWKSLLLEGEVHLETAAAIAGMLASIISASRRSGEWEQTFGDQTVFDELRLDPYYRSTAVRHPDLAPHFDRLICRCREHRYSLVHGDWSPKNFLVSGTGVTAIYFEVIHYGDPAFDAAFLLNHLLLKSFYRPDCAPRYREAAQVFWATLTAALGPDAGWLEAATIEHLGGLLLARIDGKSPAEYIRSEELRERIRAHARRLILDPPDRIAEVFP